ncbi:DUF2993 domain-containing protein [Aerosakkonema funiforme]|uniref:LmeA family phospholipid-binding protein n=1 Tax=Aerosakkonema funiforme TaxID=1246630 RepID=UPI0035B7FD5A
MTRSLKVAYMRSGDDIMTRDEELRLEEEVLSAAAEIGVISQVDKVEDVNIDVKTNLLNIVQGQADSVSFAGQGLAIQKDIRVQEVQVQTGRIAINPLSAIFGEIKLTHPTDASIRVVLTEEDINRSLNSDYIRSKLPPLELDVDGKIVSIELQHMEINLPGDGKIKCSGNVLLHEGNTRQLDFIALLYPRTSSQPLLLEAFHCTPGNGIGLELIVALMLKFKELVNLPYYEVEGSAFRVKDMDVQKGSLTVMAEAYIRQIPSM